MASVLLTTLYEHFFLLRSARPGIEFGKDSLNPAGKQDRYTRRAQQKPLMVPDPLVSHLSQLRAEPSFLSSLEGCSSPYLCYKISGFSTAVPLVNISPAAGCSFTLKNAVLQDWRGIAPAPGRIMSLLVFLTISTLNI